MTKELDKKQQSEKELRILNIIKTIFFITIVINIFLFASKHETVSNALNYKVLIEDDSGQFVEYDSATFPTNGYLFDSYECENDGVITQNPSTLKLSFTGNPDQCTIKYRINATGSSVETLELLQALNSSITVNSGTPNFSNTATSNEGMYRSVDDYGISYYFRGSSDSNYVRFGKNNSNQDLYWRIVRINGDGSLRLFYAGTSATAKESIGTSQFNSSSNSNAYVGYMYGNSSSSATYEQTHANTNSSAVKTILDNWYVNNIKNKSYEKYVSDTVFCNDRTTTSGTGYGTDASYYSARTRVNDNKAPILTCTQKNDAFTVNDTDVGNGALSYPVGLLSLDEVAMAGLVYGVLYPNSNSYLHKGFNYWLLSPAHYRTGEADNANVNSTGSLGSDDVNQSSMNVVPVINITHDAVREFIGTGTSTDPFRIPSSEDMLAKIQSLNSGITYNTGTPNFAVSATTNEGLYSAPDDYGTSYYFRGNVTNNYVRFNNQYWRIVRINGNGSLKLYYQGTSATAKNGYAQTSAYNNGKRPDTNANINYASAAYAGYMYGPESGAHANTYNSTAKTNLEAWYSNNLASKASYFDDTVAFCNDRSCSSGNCTGTSASTFAAKARLTANPPAPILTCATARDRFTVSSANGNGKLTYPIGLITADEVAMVGHVFGNASYNNTSTYLVKDKDAWNMTAGDVHSSGLNMRVGISNITSTGFLGIAEVGYDGAVIVPVVNIKFNYAYQMTGSGTSSNPFVIN